MVVSPEGSPSQLLLSTIFNYENPIGNISYDIYEDLKQDDRINNVVPLALGDSYNGFRK
ncbi:hypothetical protein [Natranaerobius trueperi]|uniref:hypothetical protein n=1 Tax=Natranaerobius trueperi TaxID=759412 RepID=UPI001303F0AF|nr:hypothetical protein [Natranaerobius trueperi]